MIKSIMIMEIVKLFEAEITGLASPALVLIAVLLYGLVHSALASLTAKALAQKLMGSWAGRVYRLAYNLFALVSLLPVLALPALLPDRVLYTIPKPWVLLTTALQAAAALGLVLSVSQTGLLSFLGLQQLRAPQPQKQQGLVLNGLYRWVRHPIYTTGLIVLWLVPRMTLNFLALSLGLTIYIVIGAVFEERKLLAEFGDSYLRYRKSTPMLIPGKKPLR